MAVQYSDGPLHVSPDDFIAVDGDIMYAIKFRYIDAMMTTLAMVVERKDGDWCSARIIDSDVETGIIRAGGPKTYAEDVIRPAVKEWLRDRKTQKPTLAQEVAAIVGKWGSV